MEYDTEIITNLKFSFRVKGKRQENEIFVELHNKKFIRKEMKL